MKTSIRSLIITFLLFALAACGGGGSSTTGGATVTPGMTVISGTASLNLVKRAKVKVYLLTADGHKVLATETTTDTYGRYSITIPTPSVPVVVEVSGGTYVDEATGLTVTRSETDVLHASVSSVGASAAIAVTPLTDLAYQLAGPSPTSASIVQANAVVSDAFNFDVIATQPVDPVAQTFIDHQTYGGGSTAQKDYTMALAALSQQVQDSHGTLASVIETYRADLASDGAVSTATAAAFTTEVSRFITSPRNETGATLISTGLSTFGATTHLVKLNTSGTFASGSFINALQLTLQIPAGMTIQNDNGIPKAGIVTPSGVAASVTTYDSYYNEGTRTLRIGVINAQPGFGLGEFMKISCDVAPGAALNPSDFIISGKTISGQGGDGTLTDYIAVFATL